jgi:predicted permease
LNQEAGVIQEVRYVLRSLGRSAGSSAAIVATVILGLAFVMAAATAFDRLLLDPLPFLRSGELVSVQLHAAGKPELVPPAVFLRWHDRLTLIEDVAAIESARTSNVVRFDLLDHGPAQRIYGAAVSVNMFSMLGLRAHVGRSFEPGDATLGAEPIVILSYELWQRVFGEDPAIVGQSIRLVSVRDERYRVVGVMPRGCRILYSSLGSSTSSPSQDEMLWVPVRVSPEMYSARGEAWAEVIGRLRPGVDLRAAEAEAQAAIDQVYPGSTRYRVVLSKLTEQVTREIRQPLVSLALAALFVWLVASVGAANLILVRGVQRVHEFALLAAIGADARVLWRMSLFESLALVLPAGVAGFLGAGVLLKTLSVFVPADILQGRELVGDWRSGVFAIAFALVTIAICTAVPTLRLRTVNLADLLRPGGPRITDATTRRTQEFLIIGQLALALALLMCATLLTESFANIMRIRLGFNHPSVVTLTTTVYQDAYRTDERRMAFLDSVLANLRGAPAVKSVGLTSSLPLLGPNVKGPIMLVPATDVEAFGALRAVTPGYFETMETRLLRGRGFTDQDSARAAKVTLVSQSFAERYFGAVDPIGRYLRFGDSSRDREIVGIIEDIRHAGIRDAPDPTVYVPYEQWPMSKVSIVVRTEDVGSANVLREAAARLEPSIPWEVALMTDVVQRYRRMDQLFMATFAVFGIVATALGCLGVYGVVARSVSQRMRELAVRAVLGATTGRSSLPCSRECWCLSRPASCSASSRAPGSASFSEICCTGYSLDHTC